MEEVIVTVSWELLFTAGVRVAPLNTTSEEETKLLPVRVRTKLGGTCEKTWVAGEIERRTGAGRALAHSGFSASQPARSKRRTSSELRRPVPREEGMKTPHLSVWVLGNSSPGKSQGSLTSSGSRWWCAGPPRSTPPDRALRRGVLNGPTSMRLCESWAHPRIVGRWVADSTERRRNFRRHFQIQGMALHCRHSPGNSPV